MIGNESDQPVLSPSQAFRKKATTKSGKANGRQGPERRAEPAGIQSKPRR